MEAASYHPRISIPKYEQTDNVKSLTANRGLQFAVGWPNLDLKVSINSFELRFVWNNRGQKHFFLFAIMTLKYNKNKKYTDTKRERE